MNNRIIPGVSIVVIIASSLWISFLLMRQAVLVAAPASHLSAPAEAMVAATPTPQPIQVAGLTPMTVIEAVAPQPTAPAPAPAPTQRPAPSPTDAPPTATMQPTQTPQPTATLVPPTPQPTATPQPAGIVNGDFEAGERAWDTEGSPRIWDKPEYAHNGRWSAMLGGVEPDGEEIAQRLIVPQDKPYLVYWSQGSGDWFDCYIDGGYIRVDAQPDDREPSSELVGSHHEFCEEDSQREYHQYVIDLKSYAGRAVELRFDMRSSGEYSFWHIDDIGFEATQPPTAIVQQSFSEIEAEIDAMLTATVPPPAPAAPAKTSEGVRTGAVCNDGTTSSATGRGACSRHGGVAYWLN